MRLLQQIDRRRDQGRPAGRALGRGTIAAPGPESRAESCPSRILLLLGAFDKLVEG